MTPAHYPQTVEQVAALLREIDRDLPETDGLLWFNRLYLLISEAVRERLAAGAFHHPGWMAKLEVRFAACYFEALEAWQADRPAPGCWRALFRHREDAAVARAQFALAGVNAHINHDLPMALVDAFVETCSSPQHAATQYEDFTSLHDVLAGLIDQVRREWLVRLSGDALPPAAHVGNTLAAWSLKAAREAAWTNAELLWDVREIPLIAGRRLDVIDGLATVAGKAMLVPAP